FESPPAWGRGTLFDFGVGSASWGLAPEKNWEHSIKLQLPAGNVGFMRRLRLFANEPAFIWLYLQ
ncbi:hypothetical protein C6381_19985, partial [Pseudomonas syringae pv. actinidiae]